MRKSFTLFELILAIILIALVYSIALGNFSSFLKEKQTRVNMTNLKSFLLVKYDFKNDVTIRCVEEGKECLVYVDGNINKKATIKNLFKGIPNMYSFKNSEIEKIDTYDVKVGDLDTKTVYFHFSVYKNGKSSNVIAEDEDKTYLYDSLFLQPKEFPYLSDVSSYFENLNYELKDAI